METISSEEKQRIIAILSKKGANNPCPRCNQNNFTLLDGYFNQTIQQTISSVVLGGPSVPSAIIVCNNCGYMSQHALGVLGLIPITEVKK